MRADDVFAILNKKINNIHVSGGGVSDYKDLDGKPQINGVTLQGNVTLEDLGIEEFSGQYNDLQGKPESLPNPQPITFGGILPEITYDGSQAVDIVFPSTEMMNESVGTPVGEIISYMGNKVPENYLACDGSEYNISDYPHLTQHFTDNFGSVNYFGGDGETTFAVPDLRGEFLRGTGENSHTYTYKGATGNEGSGSDTGTHQGATLEPILSNNVIAEEISNGWVGTFAGDVNTELDSVENRKYDSAVGNSFGFYTGAGFYEIEGKNTIGTTRPTNTSVLYCIKYKPTYFVKTGQLSELANNLTTDSEGYALDARQGKILDEKILSYFNSGIRVIWETMQYYDANNLPINSVIFYSADVGHTNFPTGATFGACINIKVIDQGFQFVSDHTGHFYIRSLWSAGTQWTPWKSIY